MENFFGTLKTECLYRSHFATHAEVEQLVTEYKERHLIEYFFNKLKALLRPIMTSWPPRFLHSFCWPPSGY